jgi:aerobic C4-dicarboxylate transport protein
VTLLALVLALAAVNLLRPGAGMNVDLASLDRSALPAVPAGAPAAGWAGLLAHVVPGSLAGAFVQGEPLQVLFVAVLVAAGLCLAGPAGRPVFQLVEALVAVFFRITGLLMWVAPIGAFGSIAFTVGRFGAGSLASLGLLLAEFYAVSLVFVLVILGAIARLAGCSLWRLMVFIRDEIVVVAATTSTETVLPRLMEKLRRIGCDEGVVGLVVPAGYSFNLDGTCLYLATAAVFLAQATDTPLDLPAQLGLLFVLLVSSKGAAGIAGTALVVLTATLGSAGTIPVESVALLIGIHRLMAEALTFVNLIGNAVAAIVVARWEGAIDPVAFAAGVGCRSMSNQLLSSGRTSC